jgi:membrane-associated phospholipid phosphatase
VAVSGEQEKEDSKVTPFTDFGQNFKRSFTGKNIWYPTAAIGLSYVIVQSGLDGRTLEWSSQLNPDATSIIGHAGIWSGYLAPVAVPLAMLLKSDKNSDLRTASYAVMQSVGIALITTNVLKVFTGRKGPDPDHPDKDALSKEFNFGILKGGLHHGWPSGHMMVNTAMVTCLSSYYPEKTWLKYTSWGFMSFMAFTVLIHDGGTAHWFSDIVAGGIMGYAIGTTVGNNFRKHRAGNISFGALDYQASNIFISPVLGWDYNGITFGIRL